MRRIIKLVLVVIWMILIFSFSNDNGQISTKKSDSFIIKIVETICDAELSNAKKDKLTNYLVKPVRKVAHLGIYFILGILIFNFILEFIPIGYRSILLSLGISFIYACSDEVHQAFIPGRSGMFSDVVLDTIGASIGILVFVIVVRMCSRREQKERVS